MEKKLHFEDALEAVHPMTWQDLGAMYRQDCADDIADYKELQKKALEVVSEMAESAAATTDSADDYRHKLMGNLLSLRSICMVLRQHLILGMDAQAKEKFDQALVTLYPF